MKEDMQELQEAINEESCLQLESKGDQEFNLLLDDVLDHY